jgi:hypothetical protein
MKFFTRAWTTGELTDEEHAGMPDAYWRYLATLQLPPAIAALSKVNVHDAFVLAIDHQPAHSLLTLRLRCGDLQRGYSDVTLAFSHVTVDLATLDTLRRAVRPADVEVLYDEIGRSDDRFEYRLLMYPNGEMNIQFRRVEVTERPVASRNA